MTSPPNALRAARQRRGYRSQKDLADALNRAALNAGLRISINQRTVRRWETDNPPLPQPDHARALELLFDCPITELGFTPTRDQGTRQQASGYRETWASRHAGSSVGALPPSVASDFMTSTAAYRRMYWTLPADRLERLVAEHAALGWDLLPQVPGVARALMARAVAESALLAGRLEFFDLQQPDQARPSFGLALRAAGEADDDLLGAAALAHMAFAPAFSYDPDQPEDARDLSEEAREKMRAAFAFARRGEASAEMTAWLYAVDAEVETRLGDTDRALDLIGRAEESYRLYEPESNATPPWMDWFSPVRLAGFKGNTQIAAGQGTAARTTLEQALGELPPEAIKQRAVFYADLAAAAVLELDPVQACADLDEALKSLGEHWYGTAMDRVRTVRQSLRAWDSLPQVRALDDELYSWHTMIKSLSA